MSYRRAGDTWCALRAGYLRLQTHTHTLRLCHTDSFSTATMVARTRLIVTLYVQYIACLVVYLNCYLFISVKLIIDSRNSFPFIYALQISLMCHFSVKSVCKRIEEIGHINSDNRTSSSLRIAGEGNDSDPRRCVFKILLRTSSVSLCMSVWV